MLLLRRLKGEKPKLHSVIYLLITVKNRLWISVIGYINVQIIGIGYKKINRWITNSLYCVCRSSACYCGSYAGQTCFLLSFHEMSQNQSKPPIFHNSSDSWHDNGKCEQTLDMSVVSRVSDQYRVSFFQQWLVLITSTHVWKQINTSAAWTRSTWFVLWICAIQALLFLFIKAQRKIVTL